MSIQILQLIFASLFFVAFCGSLVSLSKGLSLVKTPGHRVAKRPDNVYRFMAGVYLGLGIICLWMAMTMEKQYELVYLVALAVFLGGIGRVISIRSKGVPDKKFYLYTMAELGLPVVITMLNILRP